MLLLVDVGNSRLKWASWDAGKLTPGEALAYRAEEFAAVLGEAWAELGAVTRVVVSCVAGPPVIAALQDWARDRWGCVPEFARAEVAAHGVRNAYREPQRLGSDRWAALVAAHRRWPEALCLVDCGTAVTVDALRGDGQHLGGFIVPGLQLMRHALIQSTSGIAAADVGRHRPALFAHDTGTGVAEGSLHAVAGFAERMVRLSTAALGAPPRCVMTGGDAPRVLEVLDGTWEYAPQLVLEGLAEIAQGSGASK